MAEELKDASLHLPRAMMWATFGNGVMGIVMLISFCFCIDAAAIVDSTSDFPVIQVLYNATHSYAATCVLGSVLVILVFFSTVTTIASASRQIWAFSRDQVSWKGYNIPQSSSDSFNRASHSRHGYATSLQHGRFH